MKLARIVTLFCAFAAAPAASSSEIVITDYADAVIGVAQKSKAADVLAGIHDKATAMAAVPQLEAMADELERADFQIGSLYYRDKCFGVEALECLLRNSVARYEDSEGFRENLPFYVAEAQAQASTLSAIAEQIRQARDAKSEAAAIAALRDFPRLCRELAEKRKAEMEAAGVPPFYSYTYDPLRGIAESYVYPATSELLHACAEAVKRRENHFPALMEALQQLWEEADSVLPGNAAPDVSAKGMAQHDGLKKAMQEWLQRAPGICNQTTADEAAEWLDRKNAELGERRLTESMLSDTEYRVFNCPCLAPLVDACRRRNQILIRDSAPCLYFASEKLYAMLPDGFMPDAAPSPYSEPGDISPLDMLREWKAQLYGKWHNELYSLLVGVHDKASADAAAPRLRQTLRAAPADAEPELPPGIELYLHRCVRYYGSPALAEALAPLLRGEAGAKDAPAAFIAHISTLRAKLTSLTATLEQVTDAATEAQAVAAIEALPAWLLHWQAGCTKLQPAVNAYGAEGIAIQAELEWTLPALVDELFHACGRAQARVEGGCPDLVKAMQHAWLTIDEIPFFPPLADLNPALLAQAEEHTKALAEWFTLVGGIRDKASADAAADWLTQQSSRLGERFFLPWESNKVHDTEPCCCPQLQDFAVLGSYLYLKCASPAYFGSEKLAQHFCNMDKSNLILEAAAPFSPNARRREELFPYPAAGATEDSTDTPEEDEEGS